MMKNEHWRKVSAMRAWEKNIRRVENMLNLGVSFALDRVNNKTNSKAAMAKEIDSLQNQVAQLTAMVNELSKQITTEKK